MKNVWDYNLPKNFKPKNNYEWEWYLVRKINYGDFEGLKKSIVKRFFPVIKKRLDPGKRAMLDYFLRG